MEVPSDWAEDQEQRRVLKHREPLESATTSQEFVNELDLAMNYQEPAKRKYDNRGQRDLLIVLFEYVLQALFCIRVDKKYFRFRLRKWREKWKIQSERESGK